MKIRLNIKIIGFLFLVIPTITVRCKQKQYVTPKINTKAKEFYFVRHGQTDHNIGKSTHVDVALNQCGCQQAELLRTAISVLPIKTVCYSPLLRAQETTQIIFNGLPIKALQISDLREWSMPTRMNFKDLIIKEFADLSDSAKQFVFQVKHGVESALSNPGPVLIVSHGGVYCVLRHLLQAQTSEWMIGNCALVHFYKDKQGLWHAEQLNKVFKDGACAAVYS